MIVMGLDLSLTGTGLHVLEGPEKPKPWEGPSHLVKTTPDHGTTEQRILMVWRGITGFLKAKEIRPHLIIIEGPSFASQGNSGAYRAGLSYFVRCKLTDLSVPYHVVAPTSLKKFVVKGNAQKNVMLLEVFDRWKVKFHDDNLADAYALARYGHEVIGSPGAATNGAVPKKTPKKKKALDPNL